MGWLVLDEKRFPSKTTMAYGAGINPHTPLSES
jgi:hypothetical protein